MPDTQLVVSSGRAPGAPVSIVFVDDEKDIVTVFTRFLERAGFHVTGFTEPMRALDYFMQNHERISLIITDLRMPQMDGIALASGVRKISADVKIILMTAFETSGHTKEIHELKISPILCKPISPANLKMIVDRTLGAASC